MTCPQCGARCRTQLDEWGNPITTPWRVECTHCTYRGPAAATEEEAKAAHEGAERWDST